MTVRPTVVDHAPLEVALVIFNLSGLLAIAIGVAVFVALGSSFPVLALLAGAAAAMIVDLYTRLSKRGPDDDGSLGLLFSPRMGGHVWFVPVWVSALVIGISGLVLPYIDGSARAARAAATTGPAAEVPIPVVETAPPPPAERTFCDAPLAEKSERTEDGLDGKFCVDAHGVRQGPYEAAYSNGQRAMRGWYVNGRRDGPWTGWHDNGQIAQEATFKDDVVDGRLRIYDASGSIVRDEIVNASAQTPEPKAAAKKAKKGARRDR